MDREPAPYDILIAGAGFAGLGLAVALKQTLGGAYSVAVVDPGLDGQPARDGRASAIAAAGRRFFERLGVWQSGEAQPIRAMIVTDSGLDDPIRPTFLTFDGEVAPGEPFAHMIENRFLLDALTSRAQAIGVVLVRDSVTGFRSGDDEDRVILRLGSGAEAAARLAVGADGANSALRGAAGIPAYGHDYRQSGIVTTVAHERDHDGRAEEHFLPGGPFAILPLTGKRSSIVWTEPSDLAERLVALDDLSFLIELERRFGLRLGDIALAGPRRAYPLALRVARSFVADRLALVGEAAHVIHPLAGQGLNMGLHDIAALAECVIDTARLGLDIGSPETLERYQRWRRFDTAAMAMATDGLNRLFSNAAEPLRTLRDIGLGLVDRLPAAKRGFIREAAGTAGKVPRLMR